jgi:F-type H+-transporting ATPase subunit a
VSSFNEFCKSRSGFCKVQTEIAHEATEQAHEGAHAEPTDVNLKLRHIGHVLDSHTLLFSQMK